MPRTQDYLNFAATLALLLLLVPVSSEPAFGQSTADDTCPSTPQSCANSPAPHSPPILTQPSSLSGLWSQLAPQSSGEPARNPSSARVNYRVLLRPGSAPLPQATQTPAGNTVTVPISDETEKAIAEVRSRLGNAGSRFSDLISPADEARLFAEALNQVRQEQQQSPSAPQTQPVPPLPHTPQAPAHQAPAQAAAPHNLLVPPNYPPPAPLPPSPAMMQPVPSNQPNLGAHPPTPQIHWAPGQPVPPQQPVWQSPTPISPQLHPPMSAPGLKPNWGGWNNRGQQPGQPIQLAPSVSPQETEQAAMRRIARQIDALAEQLENIKRYSEADSLRRSAQQFREAVR